MERQLSNDDSAKLLKVLKDSGVNVLFNQSVTGIDKKGGEILVNSNNGGKFDVGLVSCGFKPRTELAAAAGLAVNRGIKVNSFMQTTDPAIFAIGDVAELPNGKLYAFILPIRGQAQWLAEYLVDEDIQPWIAPDFKPKSKVHGFVADNPKFF
jgi:NAD(P)H-nitrite reductase large subunit